MAGDESISRVPPPKDPTSLPTHHDPSGPCPWCGLIASFRPLAEAVLDSHIVPGTQTHRAYVNERRRAYVLSCNACNRGTIVVTDERGAGLHWWPAPGMGILDPAVPNGIAGAYDEGMRCLSIRANRAAAVMFRSALHLFVKDKGGDAAKGERHLKSALSLMKRDGDLHKSLWDWADHLNQLGNEGAHPEDYDEVTSEEADGLAKFVRQLMAIEYEMPARLQRDRDSSLQATVALDTSASPQPPGASGVDR